MATQQTMPVTLVISHGFQGIELYPQVQDVTVAGTHAGCSMAPNQIVTDDGLFGGLPPDPSTQILANAIASTATVFGTQANAVAKAVTTGALLYAMGLTDYHVCLNPSGNVTVTLPQNPTVGVTYTIDNCSNSTANNITINPYNSSDFIDGSHSYAFSNAYGSWSGYWTGGPTPIWKTSGSR